jgi:hypothetical protein
VNDPFSASPVAGPGCVDGVLRRRRGFCDLLGRKSDRTPPRDLRRLGDERPETRNAHGHRLSLLGDAGCGAVNDRRERDGEPARRKHRDG